MLGVRELRPQVFECLPPTLPAKERPYHPCAPTFTHPCGKLTIHLDESPNRSCGRYRAWALCPMCGFSFH